MSFYVCKKVYNYLKKEQKCVSELLFKYRDKKNKPHRRPTMKTKVTKVMLIVTIAVLFMTGCNMNTLGKQSDKVNKTQTVEIGFHNKARVKEKHFRTFQPNFCHQTG